MTGGTAPTGEEAIKPTPRPDAVARTLRKAVAERPLSIEASGASMGRTISSGERARLEPGDHPRWGEVWAFCDDRGAVVLHRFRRHRAQGFLFQGDACGRPDPLVSPSRLVGRVVAVEREGVVRPLRNCSRWVGGVSTELRHGGRRAAVAALGALRLRTQLRRWRTWLAR